VFGLSRGLAARLDDRFAVLTSGRRTALPRHQTLRAAMDWSYEVLPETEADHFAARCRVPGRFHHRCSGCGCQRRTASAPPMFFEAIANLAAKSLISTDISSDVTYHRLLDTMRAYALGKAERKRRDRTGQSASRGEVLSRSLRARRKPNGRRGPRPNGWAITGAGSTTSARPSIGPFSPGGDASIGGALTAAAVPLWVHLSLMEECRGRVERALARPCA